MCSYYSEPRSILSINIEEREEVNYRLNQVDPIMY